MEDIIKNNIVTKIVYNTLLSLIEKQKNDNKKKDISALKEENNLYFMPKYSFL